MPRDWRKPSLGGVGTTGSTVNDDAIRLGHVRQRSDDAQLIVVCRLPIRHDIDSLAIALASFVQRAPMKLLGWNIVIHDDQEVVVTIPACASARPGTEQDYLRGLKCSTTACSRSAGTLREAMPLL